MKKILNFVEEVCSVSINSMIWGVVLYAQRKLSFFLQEWQSILITIQSEFEWQSLHEKWNFSDHNGELFQVFHRKKWARLLELTYIHAYAWMSVSKWWLNTAVTHWAVDPHLHTGGIGLLEQ